MIKPGLFLSVEINPGNITLSKKASYKLSMIPLDCQKSKQYCVVYGSIYMLQSYF